MKEHSELKELQRKTQQELENALQDAKTTSQFLSVAEAARKDVRDPTAHTKCVLYPDWHVVLGVGRGRERQDETSRE